MKTTGRGRRLALGAMLASAASLVSTVPVVATTPGAGPGPGDLLTVGRLGVTVPEPGHSVEAFSDFADGSSESLLVETTQDGVVRVNPDAGAPTKESFARFTEALAATGECSDDFTSFDSQVGWTGPMQWWFNSPSTPGSLSLGLVVDDLRAGTTNVTQENNNCGRPDRMSGSASYQGTNSNGVNISVDNICLSDDGVSEVSFGTLTNTTIATTCNWNVGGLAPHRTESDIKFNKQDFDFTTGSCAGAFSSAYYVEGIMTHERGHTWNVRDFPTGHPNQTMGGANGQCPGPDAKQTLGLGDMLSLEARY